MQRQNRSSTPPPTPQGEELDRVPIPNHRRRSWIDARRELAAAEARILVELSGTYRNEPMENAYPAYPLLPAPTIETLMEYDFETVERACDNEFIDNWVNGADDSEELVNLWELLERRRRQRDIIRRLRREVALQTLPALPPTIQRR